MGYSNQFFEALGLNGEFAQEIKSAAEKTGIPVARLNHYSESNTLPSGEYLRKSKSTTAYQSSS